MIDMLKNLVKKVDNMQELMGNLRRDGNYKKKSSARNKILHQRSKISSTGFLAQWTQKNQRT